MAGAGITDAKLQGLKAPATGRIELSDTSVPGLRVRVGTSGAKTFIVRKRIGGRIRNITVGRYGPRFTLADARKKARTILSDIEAGGDPTATMATPRKAQAGAETIRGLLPEYLAAKSEKRSAGEIKRVLEGYVLPALGDRMADAVTRADVTRGNTWGWMPHMSPLCSAQLAELSWVEDWLCPGFSSAFRANLLFEQLLRSARSTIEESGM